MHLRNPYFLLIALSPFFLFSYPLIQVFNLLLIILIFADCVLSGVYNPSKIFLLNKREKSFLACSIIVIVFLAFHAIILPIFTLVATVGIGIRVLSVLLFALAARQKRVDFTVAYKIGLVSACILSLFNDRLSFFPETLNSNSLSITIVAFTYMLGASVNGSLNKFKIPLKYILISLIGLSLCSSRSTLIAFLVILIFGLLRYSIIAFYTGTLKKSKIKILALSLSTVVLFTSSFAIWTSLGGLYSLNRLNTIVRMEAQQGTGDIKRLIFIKNALNSIYETPFIGNGSGYTKSISFTDDYRDVRRSIHNTYLTIVVDYGFIGLILLGIWIYTCLSLKSSTSSDSKIAIVVYLVIVSFLTDIIATPAFMLLLLFLSTSLGPSFKPRSHQL